MWKNSTARGSGDASIERILKNISTTHGNESFESAFRTWEKGHVGELDARKRLAWLQCLSFYVHQDTDGDGIPDWSALNYGATPAFVLYPQDEDIDGDGTPNMLDPDPFDRKTKGVTYPKEIPAHLKIFRAEAGELQEQVFKEFGIIAVDHTDEHSSVVLKNLLVLLRYGFSAVSVRTISSLRYVYAFAGHDSEIDLAAYHPEAQAISIGGLSVYSEGEESVTLQTKILASLAHEMGHAFIFDRMSAPELCRVSEAFGGWGDLFDKGTPLSLYDPVFFLHHPLGKGELVSSYSAVGVHEWFSDTFAAFILNHLGRENHLGSDWRKRMVGPAKGRRAHWFNYNSVPRGFSAWLREKLKR